MTPSSFSLARQASSHAFGIFGALLVHAFFLQAITLGASTAKRSPPQDETGPGASAILSSTGEWMTLVMVQVPVTSSLQRLEEIASRGLMSSNEAIRIVSPDPAPAFEVEDGASDDAAEAAQTVGDPAVQSMLFGRYTGQISARVNRSWHRPRSAVSADSEATDTFRCQARITQDAGGNVKEIELISCDGTVAWQQSLVDAIQRASPLPAPPNPTVFTQALTLIFEADAYTPGSPEGEYEPQTHRLANASTDMPVPSNLPADTSSAVQTDATLDPSIATAPMEVIAE